MAVAIEAIGLQKTFVNHRSLRELLTRPFARAERTRALDGVDLAVREGEIFGLLGPNGAGKTTLIKILCCLVLPDRGRALVRGIETVHERQVKPCIGLVHSDERSFYWRLSARQNLRFFARLYDVAPRRIEARIDELLQRVDMQHAADRPFAGYSSGMKQRVAIARALLHDPPILLMDEPTRSLDPASSLALRRFIRDELHRRSGKTIVLATHNLREAETLTDRVAVVVSGRVRHLGGLSELRQAGWSRPRYRIGLADHTGTVDGPFRMLEDRRRNGGRELVLELRPDVELGAVLQAVLAAGAAIRSCERLERDLEDSFAEMLGTEAVAP